MFYLWPSTSIYFFFEWSTLSDLFRDRISYLDLKHSVDRWLNKPRFYPSLVQWPVSGLGSRQGDIFTLKTFLFVFLISIWVVLRWSSWQRDTKETIQGLLEKVSWCLSHRPSLMIHPNLEPWCLASHYQPFCLFLRKQPHARSQGQKAQLEELQHYTI